MIDAFIRPIRGLEKAKKERSIDKTFGVLVIALILSTVATWLIGLKYVWWLYVVFFGVQFVSVLILALGLKIALRILGGKFCEYYDTLTALAHSIAPSALAAIIAVGLIRIFAFHWVAAIIAAVVAGLVGFIGVVVAFTIKYRALMQLGRVDLLTALVGTVITWVGVMVGIYYPVIAYMLRMGLLIKPV